MGTFGTRENDSPKDSAGNVLADLKQTFYASRADAEAQTNPLGSATTGKDGRFSFSVDGKISVFGRDPFGIIRPYDTEDIGSGLSSTFLTPASAATAANTRRVMTKLKRGIADAGILVVGDSTGNETTEWVYLLTQNLASRFPAYTVLYRLWDDASSAYGAATTVQTGTGTKTLTVWNMSVAGKEPGYALSSRFAAGVAATAPDLVFISHGHNMGDATTTTAGNTFRSTILSLSEEITATHPTAGMVLLSQNPSLISGRETWQAFKAGYMEDVSNLAGYGFIDVHQAFIDYAASKGVTLASLITDSTHPSPEAQAAIWAPAVIAAMSDKTAALTSSSQRVSSIRTPARNLLTNGGFEAFGSTTPDNWTTALCTATKDTTNFESGTYGVKLTTDATSGTAYLQQSFDPAATFGRGIVSGQVVTFAVRLRAPASNTSFVGIMPKDNRGTSFAQRVDTPSAARDRFVWVFSQIRLADPCSNITLQISPRWSGTQVTECTVDRAYAILGPLPFVGGAA